MVYYVLLRAVDRFHSQVNRYPGLYDEHVEIDIPAVKVTSSAAAVVVVVVVVKGKKGKGVYSSSWIGKP